MTIFMLVNQYLWDEITHEITRGPLLQTWFNFNLSMDK